MDPEVRRRTELACRKGNSSIHATGASPGFSSEALPLVVTSMSRHMDSMTIDEYADIPASCPDVQVVDGMRFGRQAGEKFDPHLLAHISHGFEQSVSVIAKGLGLKLDKFDVSGETANARARFLLPGGTPIEKGTVAAQRITVSGIVNGKPMIRYRLNWYCTTEVDTDWDLRRSGWRVLIEGETPIDINVIFPLAKEKVSPAMAGITAYRVINAVPYVCAADPGILTTVDIPNIAPKMS
jgi:4-hydroxy-tetrahydrodipicolinate reductase